jgi:CRP-like cAMP-binding protein
MAPDTSDPVFKVWSSDDLIYGPVDLATLVQWVQERRVLRDTWVHSQAANDWVAAGDMEELRSHFEAQDSQPQVDEAATAPEARASVEDLRSFERFAPYSYDELKRFLDYCDLVTAQKGELIIKKGDLSDAMFLVLSGEVRARLKVGGHDNSLGKIGAGELFGEVAMLSRTARSADVVGEAPTRLLRLSSEAFQRLIEEDSALAARILFNISHSLATRLAERNIDLQKDLSSAFVWR